MPSAASKPRRQRADGEASKRRILEAATEIAVERGYEGTSIGLVSERSGLPASSIYWHFKDKDALIAAVIDHSFEMWLANAGGDDEEADSASVEETLTAMMKRTMTALLESSDFLRLGLMLTLERRAEEPTARRRFLTVRDEALQNTIATFGRIFPRLDAHDLRQLAALAMATADGLFIANEVGGDSAGVVAAFDVLAAAVHGAARHLEATSSRR
jgi:AcrR family transcriptional regulator